MEGRTRPAASKVGRSGRGRLFTLAVCLVASVTAVSCASTADEVIEPLWSYRIRKPPSPWVSGPGRSTLAEAGLKGDYVFHNPFTGGVIVVRASPLSFRYRHFKISDHARRIYREILEGWGNNLRALKDGRFAPLEKSWSVQGENGYQRIEFQLRGSISLPVIDEEAERKRVEEEVLSGEEKERFGPETRRMTRQRLEDEKARPRTTRGAQAKFVIILKRGRFTDVLYEFALLDHELAFSNTVKAFDRMMESLEFL